MVDRRRCRCRCCRCRCRPRRRRSPVVRGVVGDDDGEVLEDGGGREAERGFEEALFFSPRRARGGRRRRKRLFQDGVLRVEPEAADEDGRLDVNGAGDFVEEVPPPLFRHVAVVVVGVVVRPSRLSRSRSPRRRDSHGVPRASRCHGLCQSRVAGARPVPRREEQGRRRQRQRAVPASAVAIIDNDQKRELGRPPELGEAAAGPPQGEEVRQGVELGHDEQQEVVEEVEKLGAASMMRRRGREQVRRELHLNSKALPFVRGSQFDTKVSQELIIESSRRAERGVAT